MKFKTISLHQPWASAIALGNKTIETRSWPSRYNGPIAIHAAKCWTGYQRAFYSDQRAFFPKNFFLPFGVIVCIADLHCCFPTSDCIASGAEFVFGNFDPGRFAWYLRDVRPLKKTFACRGFQGFWTQEIPDQLIP